MANPLFIRRTQVPALTVLYVEPQALGGRQVILGHLVQARQVFGDAVLEPEPAPEITIGAIDQVQGGRDRVALVAFSSDVREIEELAQLDTESFKGSIGRLQARGGTFLYNAVAFAYDGLLQHADPDRINVIVAMTDGISSGTIEIVESKLREADAPVLIFTVGYGEDADLDVLQRIARLGDGQVFPSDPETIEKLYELLSAFF